MTDEELTNDEDKMGRESKAAAKPSMKDMEPDGKYVVCDGKMMTPRSIKQLKNHTIVRIVDRMMGGGKKKGQKKQDKEETTSSSESDALQDTFMNFL